MLLAVVVVPELSGDEDFFTLHEALVDSALDTLAGLLFVLVVVRSIEEPVACLDGLVKLSAQRRNIEVWESARCKQCRQLCLWGLSRGRNPQGASAGRMRA